MYGFQPSPLSYGAFNPEAITAVADLVAAGAGAGVAIGGAVAQRKAAKRAEAQARRARRRAAREAAAAPPPVPYTPPPESSTPKWVAPVVVLAGVGLVGGLIWWSQSQDKSAGKAKGKG
jgi:hypothetical protein